MSYDIWIADDEANYTFNVSALWYDHLDSEKGIKALDGLTGKQAQARIAPFWRRLHREAIRLWKDDNVGEPDLAKIYDSPNGWGSLIGALILTGELQSACAEFPRHKLHVQA